MSFELCASPLRFVASYALREVVPVPMPVPCPNAALFRKTTNHPANHRLDNQNPLGGAKKESLPGYWSTF